jgi:hypothetical protein
MPNKHISNIISLTNNKPIQATISNTKLISSGISKGENKSNKITGGSGSGKIIHKDTIKSQFNGQLPEVVSKSMEKCFYNYNELKSLFLTKKVEVTEDVENILEHIYR